MYYTDTEGIVAHFDFICHSHPQVGRGQFDVEIHEGRKMAQAGYRHVSFQEGMAKHLPLATSSVDVAMCHMLLHHMVSPRTVLSELRRVVRPGGYVVIIDAHTHKYLWTPEAFGDLHYGTDLKKLQKHLS